MFTEAVLRSPTGGANYQHKTASLVASRMGFFPSHPQLPQGFGSHSSHHQQHHSYSTNTSSTAGRLVTLHQLQTTTTANSVSAKNTLTNHPPSPWTNFMISCRPHHTNLPYHPRYGALMMSEAGFSSGQIPIDVQSSYLLQGSHSNSSSIEGSEEDSMDKSEEGDEDEDEVRITPERRKDSKQTSQQPQDPQPEKKRNPYSIEELLKKPDSVKKSSPPSATVSLQTMLLQPPCGLLVDKPCTCNLVSAIRNRHERGNSGTELAEASSSTSCASSLAVPIAVCKTETINKQTAACNT
jgi:Uncharacterized conserved protein